MQEDLEESAAAHVSIVCRSCRGQVRIGDKTCPGCGRYITDDEQAALQRRWEASDPEAARRAEESSWARWAILLVAGSYLLGAVVSGFLTNSVLAAAPGVLLCGIMVGLFFLSAKAPLPALLAAFGLFLAEQLVSFLVLPWSLLLGMMMKVVIVTALATGIGAELKSRRQRRALRRRG
jgi:hypothetical protein